MIKRIDQISPFHVMALLARAKELEAQGKDIVHMEIGEPDFPTPPPIALAGAEAIRTGDVHYTPAVGLPALRQSISDFYQKRYQLEISPERIVITPGASGALLLALGVIMNEGQEILLADPGYPCNKNFVRFLSGQSRAIAVNADTSFQLNLKHLEQNWSDNTIAAIVATPSNPTGTLLSIEEIEAMATFVTEKGGYLIVDEIYHGLVYSNDVQTALAIDKNIIVINSFSKYFNMTGWRLGWLVAPAGMTGNMDKLAQNIFLAAPTPAQYAALKAFDDDTIQILESHRQEFKQRRDYLLPELKKLGFKIEVEPEGAFYIYANCEAFTTDSFKFTRDLLETAGVAITPGIDFGHYQPEKYVRFAYTQSIDRLKEGIKRLTKALV